MGVVQLDQDLPLKQFFWVRGIHRCLLVRAHVSADSNRGCDDRGRRLCLFLVPGTTYLTHESRVSRYVYKT